ncbi:MAG: pyruvate:ferredoxin (flavodoxin) oxidoreductase [Deltaproteobacteria bacterium]|jgi:pyruvate-ferredoxin/flavodoxin oxidoreductase|nr:pyruvate:ferredoxin (flavodoxin) oxidoreductase [Deltaproteobacteria bacterium]
MKKRRMMTMDGNTAAAYVAYPFTEVAAIFPITPSSQMAELTDEWAAKGKKNLFGQTVRVVAMQSEGGAAGALHGSLQGGALTTTYTASQGLLLKVPNMYKIAGELLPGVFHVSARSLASSSLSIFGDHQDVMATRQTGFALLASSSVQDCMYLGAVAHLAAIKGRLPFLHFFDGFRTSHETQKIGVLEYEEMEKLLDWDAVNDFRRRALNPDHPTLSGMTQNPDVFFQLREAANPFHDALPGIVRESMRQINELTGMRYDFFEYYGAPDAERVIVAMGSSCCAIEEVVDALTAKGEKVGLVNVRLYRPFVEQAFRNVLPGTVKRIAVLDRTKEPGGVDPLCLDVRNALYGRPDAPMVTAGRYGLASKDFTPSQAQAVFDNLARAEPRKSFTVGIVDDVTFTSLPEPKEPVKIDRSGQTACKFWGFGSDGTVGANKSAIKIIGDHTDMYAQAYFAYDSKKSGGVTISHLRLGDKPIRSTYNVNAADFIACHSQAYVHLYDVLNGLMPGGVFLLNCMWFQEDLEQHLPGSMKRYIANNNINFYLINAIGIANDLGISGRINMIMQAAFFKLANIIPPDDAVRYLKDAVEDSYGKQGRAVVEKNFAAIDKGISAIHKVTVPDSWKTAPDTPSRKPENRPAFYDEVVVPMLRQEGDKLPVSAFRGYEDGRWPVGITGYEKRGVSVQTACWDAANCIQCNQCSFVCPHAVIRPLLATEEELKGAPEGFQTLPAIGYKGFSYHLAISSLDCTGCGLCRQACPAKTGAIGLKLLEEQRPKCEELWNFASARISYKPLEDGKINVKTSQFLQPLNEFSGACAGCGETPYAKLITQLFGDRMMLSNAAGCSTVWAAGAPSVSYTRNAAGQGPAWGFSLFEDCAEYGFGMSLGVEQVRTLIADLITRALAKSLPEPLRAAMQDWLDNRRNGNGARLRAKALEDTLSACKGADPLLNEIYRQRDYFVKRSHWIFGGDGWAYDIGYGGLDHVLACGEDVNAFVFDTEVYSNTGGQSSKATPAGAIAQFAAGGKPTPKKDLGLMAVTYGTVYVAQVALGADKAQTLRAIMEAEAYPGPSLVIAYSPCINHGIKGGMAQSLAQAKEAVDAGYWFLYRYNPLLKREGKTPFILDSRKPTGSFRDHLLKEVRYSALLTQFPDKAEELLRYAEQAAQERGAMYERLAGV